MHNRVTGCSYCHAARKAVVECGAVNAHSRDAPSRNDGVMIDFEPITYQCEAVERSPLLPLLFALAMQSPLVEATDEACLSLTH
jgi:hypothetical protein